MLNKLFYGTESIKKLLFKTSPRINNYVKSIKCQNSANENIIINPKNDFKSNPLSLIFQNIPSMVCIYTSTCICMYLSKCKYLFMYVNRCVYKYK
jgi:hypothetical protein